MADEVIKKVENLYYLQIGMQGENMSREVKIDVSDWMEKYPNASVYILFKRYNDQYAYPVATTYEDGILTWTPSTADTQVPGIGYAEVRLMYSTDDVVLKSRVLPTVVENSVTGNEGGEVPSPFEEWTNQILAAAELVTDSLEDAIDAADRAEEAAASITGDYAIPVTIDFGTVTSLPVTVEQANISSTMTVDYFEMSNPSAFSGNLTVTTADGSITVEGEISGSSTLKIKVSTTV